MKPNTPPIALARQQAHPAKNELGKRAFSKRPAEMSNEELQAALYYSRRQITPPRGHRAQRMAVIAELKKRGLPV
jgi:hypothetical protein